MMVEDRVESMREAVRSRAKEKNISLFEATTQLANETWDYDQEEIYSRWRAELLPRKQPRNPMKRLTGYLALRHPYLGWIGCTIFGFTLGATAFRPGYEFIFYPQAGLLALWLIGNYDIGLFCIKPRICGALHIRARTKPLTTVHGKKSFLLNSPQTPLVI